LSLAARFGAAAGVCLVLADCGQAPGRLDPKYGVSASARVVQLGQPVPKGGGVYRVGKPYTIGGQTYAPEENRDYRADGIASWYGEDFHGRRTANGEIFDMDSISAAHPTLPIPSYARVTNLNNRRSIIVRVNDRGPYHQGRVIDVSVRAAKLLGFFHEGTTPVRVEYVGQASLEGSDDRMLEATLRRGTPAPGPSEVRLASSRPMLPHHGSLAADGSVPAPADRPFELGQDDTRVAGRAPTNAYAAVTRRPLPQVAARQSPPARQEMAAGSASFDSRFAPAANAPVAPSEAGPVSAFAPAASGQANAAIITGRGLY
jgi:rare lipoprotein A